MEENNVRQFTPMECHVFHDYNVVFDEKGSTCGTLRKVQWVKDGNLDESKAKYEIRKIYNTAEGEKNGKGYTFSSKQGVDELVVGLIDAGFGDTKDIILHTKERDDFKEAIQAIEFFDATIEDGNGEVFDMRDILLSDDFAEASAE